MRRAIGALVVGLLAARPAGAAPCARAELTGEPAALAQVVAELGRLGGGAGNAATATATGCRVVRAWIARGEPGGFAVMIVDPSGRSERRDVGDVRLAATWIDSWLHDELEAAPALVPAPAAAASVEPAGSASPAWLAPPGADRASDGAGGSLLDRLGGGLGYAQAYARGTWTGVLGAACVRVGPVCLGGRASYLAQAAASDDPEHKTRSEQMVLATLGTAIAVGRLVLVPELGLGAGRSQSANDACKQACLYAGGVCPAACFDGNGNATIETQRETSYRPRASGGLRITVPLFEHVWLDALAAMTYVPFAHTGVWHADASEFNSGVPISIPGEPAGSVQLAIGLRIGAP